MLNVDRDLVQQARLQSQADRKLIDELVEIRKRKEKSEGLTQTVVALRMGTKQANVSRLESGEADVRRRTLRNYALAIPVPDIMTSIEKQKKAEANNQLALIKKMRSYI